MTYTNERHALSRDARWSGPGPLAAGVNRVLDLDPELGSGIVDDEWDTARRGTLGSLVRVPRGPWALPSAGASDRDDIFGLIVVEGLLGREMALGEHYIFELLCHGDVLMLHAAEPPRLGSGVKLTALSEMNLLVLRSSFISAAARWPSLLANLNRRLEAQRQRLAMHGLTAHLPRAEHRVLLALWNLADSCGRVTPDGIVLPLSLTHDVIGHLVASRRPTVTLAMGALEAAGCIRRRSDGCVILTPAAERQVEAITHTRETAAAIGQSITLRRPVTGSSETRPPARQARQINTRRRGGRQPAAPRRVGDIRPSG
jgi:CRP/FNR family transcriptional regulator, cyclic AMP receptor protein